MSWPWEAEHRRASAEFRALPPEQMKARLAEVYRRMGLSIHEMGQLPDEPVGVSRLVNATSAAYFPPGGDQVDVRKLELGTRVKHEKELGRVSADGVKPPIKRRFGKIVRLGSKGALIRWEDPNGRMFAEEWLRSVDFTVVDDNGNPIGQKELVDPAVLMRENPANFGVVPTSEQLRPGMPIDVIFAANGKSRSVPGIIRSIPQHPSQAAVVDIEGFTKPQTKRLVDLRLPEAELERILKEEAEREAEKKRRAEDEKAERYRAKEAKKDAQRASFRGPLADQVDALINPRKVEPAKQVEPAKPAPLVVPKPTASVEAPPKATGSELQTWLASGANVGEALMEKAAEVEKARSLYMDEADDMTREIHRKTAERDELIRQAEQKSVELAKIQKAIDALAALEALT